MVYQYSGQTARKRTATCPAASNGGTACAGNDQEIREGCSLNGPNRDIGRDERSQDFHRFRNWFENRFDVTCPGGCFEVIKVNFFIQT